MKKTASTRANHPGAHSEGYGGWYCPYKMSPGTMGPDHGMGPDYGHQHDYQGSQKPLEKEDVKRILEKYLASMRNPNLKLGEIEDKGYALDAEILTKDNSLAEKILVDKRMGWMRSIY